MKKGELCGTQQKKFQGIWYSNQPSKDVYRFKYSGGLGTYCAKHRPMAIYSEKANKTFFCYGGATRFRNRLEYMVGEYDHNSHKLSRPIKLCKKNTSDAHDNPVISIDGEGYIWVFASSHGISRPSYIFRSVNIFDIQKFECVDITNFSYPQPWYIGDSPKVIEFLFLHTRYDKGRRFLCTVPIGKSGRYDESKIKWLAKIEKGHYQLSEPFHSPKTTLKPSKIGTCFNFHPDPVGLNARTNIYYMETRDNGETWVTGNGKDLKLPLIEKLNLALVVDYEEHGLLVYLKDMTFDSKGNPILLYLTSPTYQSGPTDPLRIWTTAYWNGDHWRVSPSPEISKKMNQTTDIDSIITSDSNYDMGSLYVENEDLWRIIAPTNTGPQPFNPGGEVTVWESTDKGLHWKTVSSITKNSHNNHTYIRRPLHAHPEFIGFWADGNPRKKSKSSLYYYNMNRAKVKKME